MSSWSAPRRVTVQESVPQSMKDTEIDPPEVEEESYVKTGPKINRMKVQ